MPTGKNYGTKSVTCSKLVCDPAYKNRYSMQINRCAEVNGDHVVTIDFSYSGGLIAWSYLSPGNVEISLPGAHAFLFTSACESYTVLATVLAQPPAYVPGGGGGFTIEQANLPYTVGASYAPTWAQGYGEIKTTLNEDIIGNYPITAFHTAPSVAELCAEGADPGGDCANSLRRAVACLDIPTGNACLTAITSVTIKGDVFEYDDEAEECVIVEPDKTYALTKYNYPYNIFGQSHTAAAALLPPYSSGHKFWAAGIAAKFKLKEVTVTTSAGSKTYSSTFSETYTDYEVISITTSAYALTPAYPDDYTDPSAAFVTIGAAPMTNYPISSIGPCGETANCTGVQTAQSYPAKANDLITPYVQAVTISGQYASKKFRAAVISISGTVSFSAPLVGGGTNMNRPAELAYTITKPCGSTTITLSFTSRTAPGGTGTIIWNTPLTLPYAATPFTKIHSLEGCGANGGIVMSQGAGANIAYGGGAWYYSNTFAATFQVKLQA